MNFQKEHLAAPAKQRGRYGPRTCLLVLLVALALGYLFLRGLGAFLITGDRLKQADAVVALGGGGEQRVTEAVQLIGERYGQVLVLTEPGEVKAGEGPGSSYFRQTAIENGLSPHAILVTEDIQRSTHDEAVAVLRLMEKQGMRSVIVVTDPFHTQRTRMIFRDVFRGSGRTVRVHPVSNSWYRSGSWFLHKQGWRQTGQEYIKMTGYLLGIYQTLD